jgi:hypothetical protein
MHTIMKAYSNLLADVSRLSEVALAAPWDMSLDWVLYEAPGLDKQLLRFLEGDREKPIPFPEWLMPFWEKVKLAIVNAEVSNDPSENNRSGFLLKLLRQLLLFGYKSELKPSNEQLNTAQAEFVSTDESIGVWNSFFSSSDRHTFRSARALIGRVIGKCAWQEIIPSHGPGAVYPRRFPWTKGDFSTVYKTIDEKYGYYEYFKALPGFWPSASEALNDTTIIEQDSIQSKLVAVPKDSRGPRLICVHPSEAIWIQQGQRRILEKAIESHPLTRGRINFDNQSVNGSLALSSSFDREYCTLDMKEASDRISCELVRYLFGDYAYSYLECSRASSVKLLDGSVHSLRKFAPMGNAITFPVESIVFWAMVRAGIRAHHGIDCGEVFVFGDDVLFPSKYYDGAVRGLVVAGCVPNTSKTFRHGFFRESCGVDAFKGFDVTPHRLKRWRASSVVDLVSMCALAKNLRMDGFEDTAAFLYSQVRKVIGVLHLCNNPSAQGIYEYVDRDFLYMLTNEPSVKFCRKLHKWRSKITTIHSKEWEPQSHAWWHVQESLLSLSRQGQVEQTLSGSPSMGEGLTYAIPQRVQTNCGWTDVILR